jgi:endonuclease-8
VTEGDGVHRLTRRLDARLTGSTITDVDSRTSKVDSGALEGLTFRQIVPRGKHILMRLDGARTMTLHSHLKISGRWLVIGPDRYLPRRMQESLRLSLALEDGRTLVALDMPVLEVVPTAREDEVVGYLGPDILAADFDMAAAAQRIASDPLRPIVQAILDQRNVCGVGNVWAVESAFLRGLYPWRAAASVDAEALLALVRKMMTYSRDVHKGMITTGIKRRGETHWVYGRKDQPCRRCGTRILLRHGGSGQYDRETWWCPHCQPEI